jgi:metacaspase-1
MGEIMSVWFKDIGQLLSAAMMEVAAASANPARNTAARNKVSGAYDGPVIYAEGDSWFCYPKSVGPHQIEDAPSDLIEQLGERYAVFTEAKPGDVAITMRGFIHDKPGLISEIGRLKADILLLSAGGNDLLGNGRLERFLEAGSRKLTEYTASVAYSNAFWAAVDAIEVMIRESLRRHPKLQVVTHGYDYAIPSGVGPWLQKPMDALGIPRGKHAPIAKRIADQFNTALIKLAAAINADIGKRRVHHVDLRGTLSKESHWRDELHSTTAGNKLLAAKIAAKIDEIDPPK